MGFYNEKLGLFWVDLYRQVREREREEGKKAISLDCLVRRDTGEVDRFINKMGLSSPLT